MRRIVGYVLLAVGVFLVVLAPLLRFYALPELRKAPLDELAQTVSEAHNATYLQLSDQSVQTGQDLVATRRVRGDVKAGSSDTAVWDVFVRIENPGLNTLVTATTDRVAFDRKTSEAVNCCGAAVNGEPTEHSGIEYKFPFDAKKKTYQYFDTTLKTALPMA